VSAHASGAALPVARSCRFGPLDIAYDDRVLTPRPWTFAQSRWAAALAADAAPGPLLELCAGVGHIGLATAVLADRDIVQVELDPGAAVYARANAQRAGWGRRAEVRQCSLVDAVRPEECFPLVLADPPYLPSGDVDRFPGDPRLAIDGGEDGLDVLGACLAVAAGHLVDEGVLVLQVAGPGQADAVAKMAGTGPGDILEPEETRVVDEERAIMLLRRTRGRRG